MYDLLIDILIGFSLDLIRSFDGLFSTGLVCIRFEQEVSSYSI
jgi:hypothetical protein